MALAVPTLHRSLRVRCFDPRDFWALKDTSRARPEIDISPTERSRSIHRENDEETLLRPPQAVTSACHIFFDLFSDIFSLLVPPSKGRALGIPGGEVLINRTFFGPQPTPRQRPPIESESTLHAVAPLSRCRRIMNTCPMCRACDA